MEKNVVIFKSLTNQVITKLEKSQKRHVKQSSFTHYPHQHNPNHHNIHRPNRPEFLQ